MVISKPITPTLEINPYTLQELIRDIYEPLNCLIPVKKSKYIYDKLEYNTKYQNIIIKNNRRFITKTYEIKDIIGYDTETYKGKCRLIARSNKDFLFLKGIKTNEKFEACLKFLMYRSKETIIWRFFFNIDFDVSSILKLWNNVDKIKQLALGHEVQFKEYTLIWIKARLFIIKKNKQVVRFTDINNLFKSSLQKASKKYLDNIEKDNINGNLLNTSLSYWNKNENEIINYCIKDCILTRKLGLILLQHLKDAKVEIPKLLVSSASLSKQDFRKNCFIPNIHHIPEKIQQIAFDCYYGGRFEILKRGTFEKLYLYDINSQYPTLISKLPSLKYGIWKNIDYLPKKECLGYFKVILAIPDNNYISTIPVNHNGTIKFPNGYIERWFTWYDLDLMRNFIQEIKEAYIFLSSDYEYEPFKERINHHYKEKTKWKGKNDLMYNIHKLVMNSIYGCFIEKHKKEIEYFNDITKEIEIIKEYNGGILFNPVYASQITAFGRYSVLKEAWNNKHNIIAIHTDSLISDKPLDLPIGNKLGLWTLEKTGKGMIINTGMYQIDDLIKSRGIPKKSIRNWFTFAKWYNNYDNVKFEIKRMLKVSQSIVQYKNITGVNIMFNYPKTLNINSDLKRHWKRDFIDFNDVLQSNIDSYPYIAIIENKEQELHPNPLFL